MNAAIQCIKEPLLQNYTPLSDCIVKEGIEDCVSPSRFDAASRGKMRWYESTRSKLKLAMAGYLGLDV